MHISSHLCVCGGVREGGRGRGGGGRGVEEQGHIETGSDVGGRGKTRWQTPRQKQVQGSDRDRDKESQGGVGGWKGEGEGVVGREREIERTTQPQSTQESGGVCRGHILWIIHIWRKHYRATNMESTYIEKTVLLWRTHMEETVPRNLRAHISPEENTYINKRTYI